MDIDLQAGTHKTFSAPFAVRGLPKFVVICGPNGSGKTQLLELAERLAKKAEVQGAVTIDGSAIQQPDEVLLLNDLSRAEPVAIDANQIQSERTSIINFITKKENRDNKKKKYKYWADFVKERTGRFADEMEHGEVEVALPIEAIMSRDTNPGQSVRDISLYMVAYKLKRAGYADERRGIAMTEEQVIADVGTPPWKMINDLFAAAGFPHRVLEPKTLFDSYELKIVHKNGSEIRLSDLSSGEKTLFTLCLMLFNSNNVGVFPRLLLLDEPDARLHPETIPVFYKAVQEILVEKHGIQVICTTHRLETIATTKQGSLYEMYPDTPERIKPVEVVNQALARLSADVLSVLPKARCVIVEDEDDVKFYNEIRSLYAKKGQTAEWLPVFQAASTGKGNGKDSGGKTKVMSWVDKLTQSGLADLVQGIIDRDDNNQPRTGVHVTERYSIENYLCDPLVMYAGMIDEANAPVLADVPNLSAGDEYKIAKEFTEAQLQAVIDHYCSLYEAANSALKPTDKERVATTLSNGRVVTYPKWQIAHRGKDVLLGYRGVLGNVVDDKVLYRALRRLSLVPNDLFELMAKVWA